MPIYDNATKMDVILGLEASITSDTTTTGAIIDASQYECLTAAMACTVRTDGTYTLKLEHGDAANLSDAETIAVDSGMLIYNHLPHQSAAMTDGDNCPKEGVISIKRYVRASIVSTSVTTGGRVVVVWIGTPLVQPAEQE